MLAMVDSFIETAHTSLFIDTPSSAQPPHITLGTGKSILENLMKPVGLYMMIIHDT